jgi:hypothetical protein
MITATELSKLKKELRQLIDKIERLAFYSAYTDPLVRGTPGEVLRSCGRKTCPCATDPAARHVPYPVIQIYQGKKQRQISVKKDEMGIWQKAKNYQKQSRSLLELKQACLELTEIVREIIDKRVEEWQQ